MEDQLFKNFFIERLRIEKQCKENQNSPSTSTTKQYFPYNLRANQKRMMFG
jgi:hypothetical protein